MSDHYLTLGVPNDASTEDIKKAYRRLARELHPDVNPSADAADRFKEVTHAYEVLSNPDQRAKYDLGSGAGFGFGDLFDTFFNAAAGGAGAGRGPRARQERGQDALLRIDVELDDVLAGSSHEIEIDTAVRCETCEGSCCAPGTGMVTCDICRGSGQIQRSVRSLLGNVMTSTPCGSCRGYGTTIPHPCGTCSGQGRVRAKRAVAFDVPAGVDTGMRLQLSGEGEAGPAGGPNGDLYIEIKVAMHEVFSRSGDDLLATLEVQMMDAILGTTVKLKAIDGWVELEIKPGVQSGDIITVKDRGVRHLGGSGRGDLNVGVQVLVPTKVTAAEQHLYDELRSLREPVEPRFATFKQGLFAKLRERFLGGA